MITRQQVLELMPPVNGKTTQNHAENVNSLIIDQLHKNSRKARQITAKAAKLFEGKTPEETCRNIWNFLRTQITYSKDGINQNIKLPNRFILDGTGDCKSYSLFAQSILTNLGIKNVYRYASYNPVDATPQHVYNVAITPGINGNNDVIILDGVWHKFNYQKKPTFKRDYMPINTLSGTDDQIGKISLKKAVKSVQKAASNIQDKVKDTGVVKKAAQIQDKVKDTGVVKKAAQIQTQVKQDATVVGKQVIKVVNASAELAKKIPNAAKMVVGSPGRTAFRGLVALNFHNYAGKLNANKDKAFETWAKLGGNKNDLQSAINSGLKHKPILGIGCLDCRMKMQNLSGVDIPIGEPATIATALAAATPIIIAMAAILKEGLDVIKKAKESLGKQTDQDKTSDQVNQSPGPQTQVQPDGTFLSPAKQDYPVDNYQEQQRQLQKPDQAPTTEEKGSAAPLILAALAAKIIFF